MSAGPLNSINPSDVRRFAQSEEGKKIIEIIKADTSGAFNQAAMHASQGDLIAAKQILEKLLSPNNQGDTHGK